MDSKCLTELMPLRALALCCMLIGLLSLSCNDAIRQGEPNPDELPIVTFNSLVFKGGSSSDTGNARSLPVSLSFAGFNPDGRISWSALAMDVEYAHLPFAPECDLEFGDLLLSEEGPVSLSMMDRANLQLNLMVQADQEFCSIIFPQDRAAFHASGELADGRSLRIETDLFGMLVLSPDDGFFGWNIQKRYSWIAGINLSTLLPDWLLEQLEDDGEGLIRIDEGHNQTWLNAVSAAIIASFHLYRDLDADGRVDPGEISDEGSIGHGSLQQTPPPDECDEACPLQNACDEFALAVCPEIEAEKLHFPVCLDGLRIDCLRPPTSECCPGSGMEPLAVASCSGESLICEAKTDGDETDGDGIDGDETDGDVTDGDETDGDVTDGDETDRDVTDGDVTDGDADSNRMACLTIEPNPIDFGTVTVGQHASIIVTLRSICSETIRMDGIEWSNGQAADFEIFDPGDTAHAMIPSNERSTLRINYMPMDLGSDVAFLLLHSTSYDQDTQMPQAIIQVTVQGRGSLSLPEIDPEILDFGQVAVGSAVWKNLTLSNRGGGDLDILAIIPDTNPAFILDPIDLARLPLRLGYLDEVVFLVGYSPINIEPGHIDEGTLTIQTNNLLTPEYDVQLRGAPVWPVCEFSVVEPGYNDFVDSIDFGEVVLKDQKSVHLRVSSDGGATCKVESVNRSPGSSSEFHILPEIEPIIRPGEYFDYEIFYSPLLYPGEDEATVIIQTNDLRESHEYFELKLLGLGINPTIFIDPPTSQPEPFDFGDVLKNACSDAHEFAIRNYGIGTLILGHDYELTTGITDAWIISEFSESPLGDGQLRNYEETEDEITFTIMFCPLGISWITQQAVFEIMSNDSVHPRASIHLIGKGVGCPGGYYDLDDNPSDCEYLCPTPEPDLFPIEKCDGWDNDCNGETDEGFGLGQSCTGMGGCSTDSEGAPLAGVLECDANQDYGVRCSTMPGGTQVSETAYHPFDICDGLDNDCDGETDDEFPIHQACIGRGACGLGQLECESSVSVRCSSDIGGSDYPDPPPEEICNGIDDDCNGSTDDGIFFILGSGEPPQICDDCLGVVCSGTGACGWGVYECDLPSGWVRCCSDPGGSCVESRPEVCNGLDDDCDGEPDNGFNIGEICTGQGECSTVSDSVLQCDPLNEFEVICSSDIGGDDYPAWTETCNHLDDDCDGETDEDFNVGQLCEYCGCDLGVLECNPNYGIPGAPAVICSREMGGSDYQNIPELCDGLDNDCDCQTDEDFGIGSPCIGRGECGIGIWECDGLDDRICSTDIGGSEYLLREEYCDGRDNDCDSYTDEDFGIGQPCEGEGECSREEGVRECGGIDSFVCSVDPGGSQSLAEDELCDGLDNDCDGQTDEDYLIGEPCMANGVCGVDIDGEDIFGEYECAGENDRICSTAPGGSEYAPVTDMPEYCVTHDCDCDGFIGDAPVPDGDDDPFSCLGVQDGTTCAPSERDGTCRIRGIMGSCGELLTITTDYRCDGGECKKEVSSMLEMMCCTIGLGCFGSSCGDWGECIQSEDDSCSGLQSRNCTRIDCSSIGNGWYRYDVVHYESEQACFLGGDGEDCSGEGE